ncbi:MAG: phosphatidylserine/phosphatidylglycerophosphate/cardiolipin synthase family protein [Elusimicrobia bacterium]|nr:phosphatidylserine/phosphatidylglycerophosphate/cardiolipin synthase family protein [Elusimicrobiota bacterium]
MTNKKTALTILLSCVMFPGFAAAQNLGSASASLGLNGDELKASPIPQPKAEGGGVPQQFSGPEPVSYAGTAVTLWHALGTQIADLGWLPGTGAPSFEKISERVINASKSAAFPARSAGQPSLFTEPGFVSEFEAVTGASFSSSNYTRFLIDGEASFEAKDALIRSAKKSLLISSWAFYDDTTGYEAARMLIAKHKEGVDVKIIIDSIVANTHGKKVVKMMEDAGIAVIRHKDLDRSGDIWHVKVMIADDQYAVAGGMNFGDVYSHKAGTVLWRDTDILFSGPAVAEAKRLLGDVWNKQVSVRKLGFKSVDVRAPQAPEYEGGSARVAVVLQNPPKTSPILVSIVKAMYGATRNINIENAYFVALPAVTQAVLEARARGVEVNILTNSSQSIDSEGKPIVDAMAKCLIPLQQAGVNIYLKQGDMQTLHSKFMTVDGEFADIGSYNLHPRGERIDTEVNVNVLDRSSVAQLDAAFARDLAAAKKISDARELETKPGMVSQIMSQFFYAQLEQQAPGADGLIQDR